MHGRNQSAEIKAVVDALAQNTCIKTLYIQVFEEVRPAVCRAPTATQLAEVSAQ